VEAERVVLGIRDQGDRKELADALRVELLGGPNAAAEITFDMHRNYRRGPGTGRPGEYTATPLSVGGYVAIHRPMTGDELRRLRHERGARVMERGYAVLDLIQLETAYRLFRQLS
jgi:hypothetical protein